MAYAKRIHISDRAAGEGHSSQLVVKMLGKRVKSHLFRLYSVC